MLTRRPPSRIASLVSLRGAAAAARMPLLPRSFGLRITARNGMRPEWIEKRMAIHDRLNEIRADLAYAWGVIDASTPEGLQVEVTAWAPEAVAALNRAIDDYNLVAPTIGQHMMRISLTGEVQRTASQPKVAPTLRRPFGSGRMDGTSHHTQRTSSPLSFLDRVFDVLLAPGR